MKKKKPEVKERKIIVSYGTKPLKDIMKEILVVKISNT